MHAPNKLFLASSSITRHQLLTSARIPFVVIPQHADETACNWKPPAEQVVSAIARLKMAHALIPGGTEGQVCYVLTADTICVDMHGKIHGKPADYEHARAMIKIWRSACHVMTAFCLAKKTFQQDSWITTHIREQTVSSSLIFSIPDQWINDYLENAELSPLTVAGAVAMEGYGSQFVQSVQGSYTSILGLPLFELREALSELDFF